MQRFSILIPVEEAKTLQSILNIKEGCYEGNGWEDSKEEPNLLKRYTVDLSDGYKAELKIHNAYPPYASIELLTPTNEVADRHVDVELLLSYFLFHNSDGKFLVAVEIACPRCGKHPASINSEEPDVCCECQAELDAGKFKIGDRVWIFDMNHRVYVDGLGNKSLNPIYREYFVPRFILGETKMSWIIGRRMDTPLEKGDKIKKSDALNQLHTSLQKIEEVSWIQANKASLSKMVLDCKDYRKLKQIEALLTSID